MALVPALVIPFMLLGGFFINLSKVNDFRVIFYPIMYLSPFRYGFQSGMTCLGLGDDFVPAENWLNIFIMILMGLAIRVFSAVCMQIISNPKRPRMIKIN